MLGQIRSRGHRGWSGTEPSQETRFTGAYLESRFVSADWKAGTTGPCRGSHGAMGVKMVPGGSTLGSVVKLAFILLSSHWKDVSSCWAAQAWREKVNGGTVNLSFLPSFLYLFFFFFFFPISVP